MLDVSHVDPRQVIPAPRANIRDAAPRHVLRETPAPSGRHVVIY